jgi:L-2-hydroxyglutarate oxidase LhgO
MSAEPIDVIVIGAGVVGLGAARRFALAGQSVMVLEKATSFGMETSARNSEVIHAGIYYQPGTLKARLCVEGRAALYAFCRNRGVPHRSCGKLIVAAGPAQIAELARIKVNAETCGVTNLVWLDKAEVGALEPDIRCDRALFSPSTGIIDSHAYMLALLGEAEVHGASLVCNTEVTGLKRERPGWLVSIAGEQAPVVCARTVINCAGLHAGQIANMVDELPSTHRPRLRYARGCYFTYGAKTRFRHLIYPVPEPGGLGTHLTLDMAGQARFGPDVEWVDVIDYAVAANRRDKFGKAVQQFWPEVDPTQLQPAYAGIRPKLSGPGEPPADFRIDGPTDHGVPGLFNLFGIESPGLTSSLALADHVFAKWEMSQ